MLTLYSYWRSSASYRVRIALALKGIEYEQKPVSLIDGEQSSDAYKGMNPQGYLPTVHLDDGAMLTQSIPIIEYLEEAYPETPRLLPLQAADRARVRAFSAIIACDIHPIQNLSVLKFLRAEYGQGDEGVAEWCRHWIVKGFNALEPLAASGQKAFVSEDLPGLAECCLIPQVYNARRFGVDMAPFPTLADIDTKCSDIPAFEEAKPENQPDAPRDS